VLKVAERCAVRKYIEFEQAKRLFVALARRWRSRCDTFCLQISRPHKTICSRYSASQLYRIEQVFWREGLVEHYGIAALRMLA